jgi:hypothetical protein
MSWPGIEWLVIRDTQTDRTSVTAVERGTRPGPDPRFTWGGPFATCSMAMWKLETRDEELRRQLYPEEDRNGQWHL